MIHITPTEEHRPDTTHTGLIISRPAKKKRPATIHGWFDGPYDTARGETSLWVAVITQAMMDALSRSRHPEQQHHKQAALNWLTGNSKDFFLVCSLAGMDPDYVRRKAKKSLVSPIAWRAAPGQGQRYLERKHYRQRIKKMRAIPAGEDDAGRTPASACEVIIGPWR